MRAEFYPQIPKILKKIPKSPGVYFFYGAKNKILYIGKAINLRSRLNSHFQNDRLHPAKKRLIEQAQAIDWQITQSDIEALILEAALIKKHQPFYNIALRDDKNYFFVIQTKETFPRLFLTHQPKKLKADFIGPFTEGTALKNVLNYLRRVFPYCTCKKLHKRKCLNAELGKCLDFCCNKTLAPTTEQKKKYQKNIKNIWTVLSGGKKYLLANLKKEMKKESQTSNFEKAVQLRDQIWSLERIFEHRPMLENKTLEEKISQDILEKIKNLLKLPTPPKRIEVYDISNIQGKFATGAMVVFEDGAPNKNQYRKFKIKSQNTPDDYLMLQEIIARRLKNKWPFPDLFVIDGGQGQLNAALSITRKAGLKTPVIALAKKEERLYLSNKLAPIALKNQDSEILLFFQQIRDEAHRFAISYHRKLRNHTSRSA